MSGKERDDERARGRSASEREIAMQGAYVRRDATGFPLAARMRADTLGRITPLAKYLVAL